jgi:large subunit ribosomal protein L5
METTAKPRLAELYESEIRGSLKEKFGIGSLMAVPRLEKIVLNIGLGEAVQNPKLIDEALDELAKISGQRPVVTKARKSIAAFKLREGMPIGLSVTLRRARMYEFLDRLINVALPRVRDFRGLSPKAFDGRGNYSLGLREHIIFPEIELDKVEKIKGLSVTMVTSAEDDDQGRELLKAFGMPFRS